MAKFARCEACNAERPLGGRMEFNPPGWVNATEARGGLEENIDYLACSPTCMAALMTKRATELAEQAVIGGASER